MSHLTRQKRVDQIISGAREFFAEHGLSAQTRELSSYLGITQPLLYRYFPSKDALIKRILAETFEKHWNDSWTQLISETAIPVFERYKQFYMEYNRTILTRDWVRLLMHSELKNFYYGRKIIAKIRSDIFIPLCAELRLHYDYPPAQDFPMTKAEFELLLEMHGMVYYNSIRRHIYALKYVIKIEPLLENIVFFLDQTYPHLLANIFPGHRPAPGPSPAKKR